MFSNIFSEIVSFADASKIWNLDSSTLRRAVISGKLRRGIDCQKIGSQWVVLLRAMIREYGKKDHAVVSAFLEKEKQEIYEAWSNYTALGYLKFAMDRYNELQMECGGIPLTDKEMKNMKGCMYHAFDMKTLKEAYNNSKY